MAQLKGNLVIAQSGGPTAAINSSVAGVVDEAQKHSEITGILGAENGILGVLFENLFDLGKEKAGTIEALRWTPSSALGSCRRKVSEEDLKRAFNIFDAHDIRYFVIAGGNDSMDTAMRVSRFARATGYEMRVVGVPKTVDNDLAVTDHCPGYGSVARWNAIATRDAGLDTKAIYTSDPIKVIETMGRDTGWITAAAALARTHKGYVPHLVYLPEVDFIEEEFLRDVQSLHKKNGYVVIAVCEGVHDPEGRTLFESRSALDMDTFGHAQRGGVGDFLCGLIKDERGIKARADKAGTIQRVSTMLGSKTDLDEAYGVGCEAIRQVVAGNTDVMITIERLSCEPYKWRPGTVALDKVANLKRSMPRSFINEAGNDVAEAFFEWVRPLIQGTVTVPLEGGLPTYAQLAKHRVGKTLPAYA